MPDSNWSTFHGNVQRTGFVDKDQSGINSTNAGSLKVLHELSLGGPIMSVPAVYDGSVYVGTANSNLSTGNNGGAFFRIGLESGEIEAVYNWPTLSHEGDTHGFTGMGSTPAISGPFVYFSAFDGHLYCLRRETLELEWKVNLRLADPKHNQPITNISGVYDDNPQAQAEGWCSPLVVNGKVYVGIGEGENSELYSFIYCLNAANGNVEWIYCTCRFNSKEHNKPNQLPLSLVDTATLPEMFQAETDVPEKLGASVWSAISYDQDLNRIYAATGNPTGETGGKDGHGPYLPVPGSYAYGILSLDAGTGAFKGYYQIDPASSYRTSDLDVDFGASPIIFERAKPGTKDEMQKVVAAGCKNGGLFLLDAESMECLDWCQMLPKDTQEHQIPTVDPHGPDIGTDPNPRLTNQQSNCYGAENFHGTYSTPAIQPDMGRLFIGCGGNNYHFVAAGIDYTTTPFMRVYDYRNEKLKDAWPLTPFELENGQTVLRYKLPMSTVDPETPTPFGIPPEDCTTLPPATPTFCSPMYSVPGEAGLSSPAVVNDVVFCSTSRVALYAFNATDGQLLWMDRLGNQTGGFHGGYGYCLGPAIYENYVVAGALIQGNDGGVLKIYGFPKPKKG